MPESVSYSDEVEESFRAAVIRACEGCGVTAVINKGAGIHEISTSSPDLVKDRLGKPDVFCNWIDGGTFREILKKGVTVTPAQPSGVS